MTCRLLNCVFLLALLLGLTSAAIAKDRDDVCVKPGSNKTSQAEEWGNALAPVGGYDKGQIKSAISAMTLSCMVTQTKNSTVMKLFRGSGWSVIDSNGKATKDASRGIIEPKFKLKKGYSAGRAAVVVRQQSNAVVVLFRGTGVKGEPAKLVKNALVDANMRREKIRWLPSKPKASWSGLSDARHKTWKKLRVHKGFSKEYDRMFSEVDTRIAGLLKRSEISKKKTDFYCIGFSLGASLATHCGAHLKLRFNIDPNVIIGASPRTGSEKFQVAYDGLIKLSWRLMLEKDPVVQVPGNLVDKFFNHVGHRLLSLVSDSGKRMTRDALKERTHAWGNSRAYNVISGFAKYHNQTAYKDSLRKHLNQSTSDWKPSVLGNLADVERNASHKNTRQERREERRERRSERKEDRKEKRADRKESREEKRSDRKDAREQKAACEKKCKQKKRKDRRKCKKACK